MRLGVNLLHSDALPVATAAERLGFAIAFAPEGLRSDAPTVLGAVAAVTSKIALASGVIQIPARTPILTALTAATVDALAPGRFRLGLGVSNPEISESWYGVPFTRPLARTEAYVGAVRAALRGEDVGTGGVPVRLPEPPARADIPVYLAAVGPRNLRLTGRIADGWIGMFASPERTSYAVGLIHEESSRAGRAAGFDAVPCVPVFVADDVEPAIDRLRVHYARLLGIGGPDRNLYSGLARAMGHERAIGLLHERFAAGDLAGAAAAVPAGFVDATALVGPAGRIADRLHEYAAAGATTVSLMVSSAAADTAERLRILAAVAESWAKRN